MEFHYEDNKMDVEIFQKNSGNLNKNCGPEIVVTAKLK